jgi:hypothetical protein
MIGPLENAKYNPSEVTADVRERLQFKQQIIPNVDNNIEEEMELSFIYC